MAQKPQTSEVAKLFNKIAKQYDAHDDTNQLMADDLFTYSIIRKEANLSRILDLGCGTGRAIRFLNPLPDQYVGIDISAGMLLEARRKYPDYCFLNTSMLEFMSWQPSCVISLFGSPCYVPIDDLMQVLHNYWAKIYLGAFGLGRNYSTFCGALEKNVLHPWFVNQSTLDCIQDHFSKVRLWKCDLAAGHPLNLHPETYANLLRIESKLPVPISRYAWILIEIDNA